MANNVSTEWTETRTNIQDPSNPIAIPTDSPMYKSTHKAIPYADAPAPYPPGAFKTCPSVYAEVLFRYAPVASPEVLQPVKFIKKCLTEKYLQEGIQLLQDEGLFTHKDKDDNDVVHVFEGREELQGRADGLVRQLKDDPTLAVGLAEWEWLADFQGRAVDSSITWFAAISLEDLTRVTYDLTLYCDLIELVGPRSTEAIRILPGSQFHTVVRDDGDGGMLLSAIKAKYYRGTNMGVALNSNFLLGQVAKFLLATHPSNQEVLLLGRRSRRAQPRTPSC